MITPDEVIEALKDVKYVPNVVNVGTDDEPKVVSGFSFYKKLSDGKNWATTLSEGIMSEWTLEITVTYLKEWFIAREAKLKGEGESSQK